MITSTMLLPGATALPAVHERVLEGLTSSEALALFKFLDVTDHSSTLADLADRYDGFPYAIEHLAGLMRTEAAGVARRRALPPGVEALFASCLAGRSPGEHAVPRALPIVEVPSCEVRGEHQVPEPEAADQRLRTSAGPSG